MLAAKNKMQSKQPKTKKNTPQTSHSVLNVYDSYVFEAASAAFIKLSFKLHWS